MASNITWSQSIVTKQDRKQLLNQQGITLWLTGLSGSGKSTIAIALETELVHKFKLATYRLDGDNVRFGLNKDLGFSPQDREENIRRIGEVAKLFNDSGLITITSFISPYIKDRDTVRKLHEESNLKFVEVFVDTSLEQAELRDPKGLYKKARQGIIKEFTGISAPYEKPQNPEIYLDTNQLSVDQSVEKIIQFLTKELDLEN